MLIQNWKDYFKNNPWVMLVYLLLCQIGVAFLGRSIGPLSPFFEKGFHLDNFEVGLLPAFFFAGQAAISLPSGYLADRYGTRMMNLIVSIEISLTFLILASIHAYPLLLCCLFIAGMGYGAMHPSASKGVRDWFQQRNLGTAMGVKQTGVTIGSTISALVLLPLAIKFNWRISLLFAAILVLVIGVTTFLTYRDKQELGKPERLSLRTVLHLFKNKSLLFVSFASLGLNGVQICLSTYIVLYFHYGLQMGIFLASTFIITYEISGTVGRVLWGIVSDKLFSGNRVQVLMFITCIGSLVIAGFVYPSKNLFVDYVLTTLAGLCIAGFNGLWMNLASESVPIRLSGLASGLSLSMGSIGVVLIPPVFGQITKYGNYSWGWLFLALVLFGSFVTLVGLQRLTLLKRQQASFS